eukprot:GHVP01048188.1.p1 GENE.GHVP01048188.1~~GHVP01048188.1.p1  ORF type:complete len:166 (-),score=33.20 GHVP01048188.1:70-567(-)
MTSLARRRIIKDIRVLSEFTYEEGRMAMPFSDDIMLCHCVIRGPPDTIWEAGIFHLLAEFTEEYPAKPPNLKFLSKIFHPNVYPQTGNICLDLLQKGWSSLLGLPGILISLQILLAEPNPDDPANSYAAQLYMEDTAEYEIKVLECVEESWIVPNYTKEMTKEKI